MAKYIDAERLKKAFISNDKSGHYRFPAYLICKFIDEIPAADVVPCPEYDLLLRRFRHLMESSYIASFDEIDHRTGKYKRDISTAGKGDDYAEN